MRFMVMHKVDKTMEAGGPPSTEIIQNMGKYVGASKKAGVFVDGAGLHRSAARARVTPAGVERGPYNGRNEVLAGFAMVNAGSIDHAIELARSLGGEVEIGPVVEPWDLKLMDRPANAPLRFLLLRKADAATEAGATPPPVPAEWQRDGVLIAAATLAPSSRGARYRSVAGKREWTDGPFTEAKELIAGYSIVELPGLADAKQWTEAYGAILGDNEVDVRLVAS
jgi:hypothetical protein